MSPVSFFMLAASLQRLAVVRFQHLAQPRFRVKHLPSQKYEGQHAVVAVFLQGASADTEQFRHLTVSQVTFPVQRRAVPVRHHHESAPKGRRKRGGQKLRPGAQTVGHMGQTRCHGPGLSQPVRRGGKIQRHGYPPLRSDEKNATL